MSDERVSKRARARILGRVREANQEREPVEHPGALPDALEPPGPFGDAGRSDPVGAFEDRLRAAGGEVVRLADEAASAYRNPRIGQTAEAGLTLTPALRACAVTAHRMRPTDVAACTVCGSVRVFG